MTIGLITIHFQNNYGAILQTYALFSKLSSISQVEIINYIYNVRIKSQKNINIEKIMSLLRYRNRIQNRIKAKKFDTFRKKYLKISMQKYQGDEAINSNPPNYSVYIAGSDQIWNVSLTNNSSSYFLSFIKNGIKASYGSSFGHENLTNLEFDYVKKYLTSFKYISTREKKSSKELELILERKVDDVLDPVFLISKSHWINLAKTEKYQYGESDYYFAYIMEDNDSIRKAIKWVFESKKRLYIIFGSKKINNKFFRNAKIINDAGPLDFLNLILNAKLVVTNSFHAVAFSIIFNKKFIVCEHSTRNIRLQNLMEVCGMPEKYIRCSDDDSNVSNVIVDGLYAYKHIDFSSSQYAIQKIAELY